MNTVGKWGWESENGIYLDQRGGGKKDYGSNRLVGDGCTRRVKADGKKHIKEKSGVREKKGEDRHPIWTGAETGGGVWKKKGEENEGKKGAAIYEGKGDRAFRGEEESGGPTLLRGPR